MELNPHTIKGVVVPPYTIMPQVQIYYETKMNGWENHELLKYLKHTFFKDILLFIKFR